MDSSPNRTVYGLGGAMEYSVTIKQIANGWTVEYYANPQVLGQDTETQYFENYDDAAASAIKFLTYESVKQ